MAVCIPEIDCGTPFLIRKRWLPMVITSPCTWYIILLTAASHYAASHHLLTDPNIQRILLDLKYLTLTSVNKEISSQPPNQPMPDQVIGTVTKMASYEAMFGTATLYHTHMRGLQHMIGQRGGLRTLGLNGLMMRMIQWIDINSAFILGGKAYFKYREPLAGHVQTEGIGETHNRLLTDPLEPNPEGFCESHGVNGPEATVGEVPKPCNVGGGTKTGFNKVAVSYAAPELQKENALNEANQLRGQAKLDGTNGLNIASVQNTPYPSTEASSSNTASASSSRSSLPSHGANPSRSSSAPYTTAPPSQATSSNSTTSSTTASHANGPPLSQANSMPNGAWVNGAGMLNAPLAQLEAERQRWIEDRRAHAWVSCGGGGLKYSIPAERGEWEDARGVEV